MIGGHMVHLNITFPEELKIKLDQEVKRNRTKRSTLIQHAVRFYLELKHKKSQEMLLKEGYLAMGNETKVLMDAFRSIDRDSLKYVD
jgi:metal-responsive CopG/Arc/MetJ family transcriptional regulator